LVRLLRMCHEILTMGKVIVRRPDAEELLAIRDGVYTYDQLMEIVDPLMDRLTEIYGSKAYCVPFGAPKQDLSDFAVELHHQYWKYHTKCPVES